MGIFNSEIDHRFGSLQSQQTATDYCTSFHCWSISADQFKVLDGTINENALFFDAWDGRYKCRRTRCQDQYVIRNFKTVERFYLFIDAVNMLNGVAQMKINIVIPVPFRWSEGKIDG